MLIHAISKADLFTWNLTEPFSLAPGLTLLLGENGSGKTSMGLEAIAWTVWGETVRGTAPEGRSVVQLSSADGLTRHEVRRQWQRRGKNNLLELHQLDSIPPANLSGQTATETQERIDRIFGSWRRFSATRVFSRRLMARFGAATDKERKALLEEVLGLDRFERAYAWAREERGKRAQAFAEAQGEVRERTAALEQAKRSLAALGVAEASVEAIEEALEAEREKAAKGRADCEGLAKRAQGLADALQRMQGRLTQEATERDSLRRRISTHEKFMERQQAPTVCPTCRRPLDGASGAAVGQHAQSELEGLRKDLAKAEARHATFEPEVKAAREAHRQAQERHSARYQDVASAEREIAGLEARLEAARRYEAQLQAANDQVLEAQQASNLALANAAINECRLKAADEACRLLGPKGVRIRLLSGSLSLLEVGVNAVLPRLGGQAHGIRIKGSRTKADGDEVAEVAIEVLGAGGGEYRGVSDGEQTRLDVALLLALARVSGDTGYVCFDETFDGLDKEGIAGVCEVLEEMAQRRQVVVISHSDELVSLLPAAAKWRCKREGKGPSQLEPA